MREKPLPEREILPTTSGQYKHDGVRVDHVFAQSLPNSLIFNIEPNLYHLEIIEFFSSRILLCHTLALSRNQNLCQGPGRRHIVQHLNPAKRSHGDTREQKAHSGQLSQFSWKLKLIFPAMSRNCGDTVRCLRNENGNSNKNSIFQQRAAEEPT